MGAGAGVFLSSREDSDKRDQVRRIRADLDAPDGTNSYVVKLHEHLSVQIESTEYFVLHTQPLSLAFGTKS